MGKSAYKRSTTSAAPSVAGTNPVFAQTMLRVTDAKKSREYYENKLGMTFLTQLDFSDLEFSLLFFAYTNDQVPDMASVSQPERAKWLWSLPYPTIELTYNWNSDEVYVNGNKDPGRGFGHIGILVDDAVAAVDQLSANGVPVVRKASPFADVGTLAFVEDPDGYWCEVIERTGPKRVGPEKGLVGCDPVFAQSMIRIVNPDESIAFFEKLGMKLVAQLHFPENEFSLYFMAYTDLPSPPQDVSRPQVAEWLWKFRECTVELTHNWVEEGTSLDDVSYHNGNEKPYRGFGHLGVIVDDVADTTAKLEKDGYKIVRNASPFKDVAFISFVEAPTGYWVELIQRSS